jgi:hypothetical protein
MFLPAILLLFLFAVGEAAYPTRTQYGAIRAELANWEVDLNSRWHFEQLIGNNPFTLHESEKCQHIQCKLKRSLDVGGRTSGLSCHIRRASGDDDDTLIWYNEYAHRFSLGDSDLHHGELVAFIECLRLEFTPPPPPQPAERYLHQEECAPRAATTAWHGHAPHYNGDPAEPLTRRCGHAVDVPLDATGLHYAGGGAADMPLDDATESPDDPLLRQGIRVQLGGINLGMLISPRGDCQDCTTAGDDTVVEK